MLVLRFFDISHVVCSREPLRPYVPEEMLQMDELAHTNLQGATHAVAMRRSFALADGWRALVGPLQPSSGWREVAMELSGASAATLLHRSFAALWLSLGGVPYDFTAPKMRSTVLASPAWDNECAIYLAFPGNPCNVLQKHVLEVVAFSHGPMLCATTHLADPALHAQLKIVGAERLAELTLVTSVAHNPSAHAVQLLRQHGAPSLVVFDAPQPMRCSQLLSSGCVFHGSYGFTHRSDLDLSVLVRSSTVAEAVRTTIAQDAAAAQPLSPLDIAPNDALPQLTMDDTFS